MSPRVADVWKPTRQLAGAVGRCGSPDQVVGRVAELWRVRVETGREVRIAVVVFQELEQQSNRRRGPSRVAVPASAVRCHQPAPIRAACKDSLSSQAAFLSSEHAAVARVDIALLHGPDAVTTSRAEQPEYLVGPAPVVTGLVESPEPHDLDRAARRPERLRRTRWNYRPSSCDAEDGSLAAFAPRRERARRNSHHGQHRRQRPDHQHGPPSRDPAVALVPARLRQECPGPACTPRLAVPVRAGVSADGRRSHASAENSAGLDRHTGSPLQESRPINKRSPRRRSPAGTAGPSTVIQDRAIDPYVESQSIAVAERLDVTRMGPSTVADAVDKFWTHQRTFRVSDAVGR
jgi:hypothetical protein